MTHVVTENCINCRHTDCVAVCPVDAFHAGANFLAIDPDACIDCALCVAVCPAHAIVADENLPADQTGFLALNAELAKGWPVMTQKAPGLPDAARWNGVPGKLAWLKR